jgi:hypothetical protein
VAGRFSASVGLEFSQDVARFSYFPYLSRYDSARLGKFVDFFNTFMTSAGVSGKGFMRVVLILYITKVHIKILPSVNQAAQKEWRLSTNCKIVRPPREIAKP